MKKDFEIYTVSMKPSTDSLCSPQKHAEHLYIRYAYGTAASDAYQHSTAEGTWHLIKSLWVGYAAVAWIFAFACTQQILHPWCVRDLPTQSIIYR